MKIRCERCQAEYDLDDRQVRGGSTDVQCSVCGHVFAVVQPGSHQSAVGASAGSPKSADTHWFLQTAHGGVHRFHGLTSLQKWIIERRVTRLDRVSPDGQAWQSAGQMVELMPFFDVVDEANRSGSDALEEQDQAMQVESAPGAPASPLRRRSSPQAMAISVPNDNLRASRPHSSAVGRKAAVAAGSREPTHAAFKIFVGLAVAAGVAFVGIKWQQDRIHGSGKASGGISTWTIGRRPVANPPEARPDLGAGSAAVQRPGATARPSSAARGPVVEALPSPPPTETGKASDKEGRENSVAAPSESFEKLVAEGDRALENGSDSKAKDFYQRALRLRPAGAKAFSGLGFVALDRGQLPEAWGFFKRALAAKPSFGPALFGIAEIHRARNEKALALQSYQHYLQLWPKGTEAAAARRQVSALQSGR
jgi:predicted Zn finger-like uncharacterized protein